MGAAFVVPFINCMCVSDERLTAEQMDEQRIQNVAYQYLCRLEEAKRLVLGAYCSLLTLDLVNVGPRIPLLNPLLLHRWMEACLGEELPSPTELEEALRNGVILAKLGHCFAPTAVALKKIFDLEEQRYQVRE